MGAEIESGTRTGGGIGGHQGFSVSIPSVLVGRPYEFQLVTKDPVNVRAAKHLWNVFTAMSDMQSRFINLVRARYEVESITVDADLLNEGLHSNYATLFTPFVMVYGDTAERVRAATPAAVAVLEKLDELRGTYPREWEITNYHAPSFLRPVISLSTEGGFRHQVMEPIFPGLRTCSGGVEFKSADGVASMVLALPENYEGIGCDGTVLGIKILKNATRLNEWPPAGSKCGPAVEEEAR